MLQLDTRRLVQNAHLVFVILILFSLAVAEPNTVSPTLSEGVYTPRGRGNVTFLLGRVMEKRERGIHHLPHGWTVQFQTFDVFTPSWTVALSLSEFWSEIATQVSNQNWMPDDQFQRNRIALHMPIPPGQYGQPLDLIFEVFNLDAPVTRDLVQMVAVYMMRVTLKGFCGVFNARLTNRDGEAFWIILRLKRSLELNVAVNGHT